MKKVFLFSIVILFSIISCDDDPTSPPIQPENSFVKINSLKNNDAVYDSLYLDVEVTGIENIVKVVAIVDGEPMALDYNPPFQIKFRPYHYEYFSDSSQHNVYVKVYTTNDGLTYQSDVVYFTYYIFSITSFNVTHLDNNSVSLNWQDNISSLDGYNVESKKGNEPYMVIAQLSPSANQYTVTDLDTNFTYSFRIKAIKDTAYSYSREAKILSVIGGLELSESVSEGTSTLYSLVFNSDSTFFYTTDYNGYQIAKWNAATRRVISRVNTNGYSYSRLTLIENKNLIAMYSDYSIRIHRLDNGQLIKTINLEYSSSNYLHAYVPETNRFYAGQNGSLLCFDANNNFTCVDTISLNTIKQMLAYDGKLIISDNYGMIKIIDSFSNSTIRSTYLNNSLYSMCTDISRNEILVSSGSYGFYSFDLNTLLQKEQFPTNYYSQYQIDFYKNYIFSFYGSNIYAYNRDIKRATMTNSPNIYYNNYLIDHRRELVLLTNENQIKAYRFVLKWVDINTIYY